MSIKNSLIALGVIYIAVALSLVRLLGPPDLSHEFLNAQSPLATPEQTHHTNRTDYDKYLVIIKSEAYKYYEQKPEQIEKVYERFPHLHPSLPVLLEEVEFVEEFANRPEFIKESDRRAAYSLYFDWLNVVTFLLIVLRLAYKPIMGFLDDSIAKVRRRVEGARNAREGAAATLAEARERLSSLDDDKRRLDQQTEKNIAHEKKLIDEGLENDLELLRSEEKDLIAGEEAHARLILRRELVQLAVGRLVDAAKATADQERQDMNVDNFIHALEARAAQRRN